MSTRPARSLRLRCALLASLTIAVPLLVYAGAGSAEALAAPANKPMRTLDATSPPEEDPTPAPKPKRTHRAPRPDPTASLTADPTSDPTSEPTSDPTMDPTVDPTVDPTSTPEPGESSAAPAPTEAPSTPGVAPKPTVVTLDFDGSTVDQYAAGNLLQSLGIRAVFYVNSGRLDVGGDYMSTQQVRTLQAHGHEIGGNTVSRVRLSQWDAMEQRRQICGDRVSLLSAGLTASTFAYPFGDFDATTRVAVQECGYNNARTFGGLSCRGCDAAETVPPASVYGTRSVSGIGGNTTATELMVAVQRAQATGGWLQLVFQRLCSTSGCSSNAFPAREFETFARWLDGQRRDGTLAISTVHDVLGGGLRPAVAPPPATANRLRVANASFENGGTPEAPQCFSITTNGEDNVFAARRVSDRHSGLWAQEVVVTKVTGAVKLQSAQDLGSCAPPIVKQHKYRVAVWYKSTAPITVAAYTRRPTGGYSSFGTSPTFKAASQWTQAVWTTKGAPATANLALSVGVVFTSAGTYLLDDFSVADAGLAARAEAQASALETDSREGSGGTEGLFVPSDTAPRVPAGPAAASLNANQRRGWVLTVEIVGALVLMWGVFAALDRRFRQIHRRTRTQGPAHR